MLRELIDKFYLDKQHDREQTHFYITDAGKCGRSLFFKFKNVPREEMKPSVLRLFDHGDHMHQMIMKPLLSIRDIHVVASEVNIPPQEIISGRSDAILSDGKTMYVLDIKSMNSMIFDKLKEPKEENVDQLQLYLHYFKIPKGILLYVNKNSLDLKEFVIEYNQKRALGLIDILKNIKEKIDSNVIPPRLTDYPKNWQCMYCSFKDICKTTGEGQLKWESFKDRIEKSGK